MNGDTKLTEAELLISDPIGAQFLVWIGQELLHTRTRGEAMELYRAAVERDRQTAVYCLLESHLNVAPKHPTKPQQGEQHESEKEDSQTEGARGGSD